MGRKVCVVTGATSGIGRATALALGEANTDLVILGRNEGAGASLLAKLQRRGFGNASTFIQIDLADFENVRRAAGHIRRKYSKIHVLVNNAGARFNDYETTVDGLERTFATNHLGHFLLTALLLDVLLSSAARVITVGSGAHAVSPEGSWLLTRETYDRKVAYGRSKLANIMFAYELARRLQRTSVVSNALDPGGVATNLGRNNGLVPWLRHLLYYAARRELRTPRQAGSDVAHLALGDEFRATTGKYFRMGYEVKSDPSSYNRRLTAQLWDLSVRMTKLDASLGAAWKFIDPAADVAG